MCSSSKNVRQFVSQLRMFMSLFLSVGLVCSALYSLD